jgi:3-oxoacyl-[acyl-carrier-protein] synthase II
LLAGGAEELCFESFLGYLRAGRLCGSQDAGEAHVPVPYHARRNGFALAEGAALLTLEDAESAAERGAPILAEVLGHGSAFSVERTEEDAAGAVARAVRLALEDARLRPEDLDALSASASGSVAVDRWEASGLAAALGARSAELPVTAVKALTGEALGASGGFQAVALLGTLADGRLPGIPGLDATEEGFPLAGARAENRRVPVRRALLTAVSADGHCWALILGAPDARH